MTSVNVLTWNDAERRNGSYVVLGVAVVAILASLAVWWFVSTAPAWLWWTLVGVLALVLAFMAVLLFVPARAAAEATEDAMQAAPEAASENAEAAPAAAFEPRVLTLRCGDCGTIFDVTDTGERPLYHTCPGCGAEGALRDPVEAAPAAEAPPEAAPPMEAPIAAPAAVEEEPAPAAPAPAPAKKIKLRCGGCKEVFSIEDTGERPLKRACPHCGRIGQIH